MPRTTETFELAAKRDELTERLEELAEQTVHGDETDWIKETATRVQNRRDALADAVEEYGTDATVTIGELTAGEYGRAEDYIKDSIAEKDGDAADGVSRIVFVALGVQDAPFLDDGLDTDGKVAAVSQLPPALVQFLEAEVNQVTTPSGNGCASFSELLAEKQSETSSTEK